MSNGSGQTESDLDNKVLTNSYKEEYKSFFLKKESFDAIKTINGWHGRGSISRFAEHLGITRQYAALIVSGKAGCSAFVMRKIKRLLNINGACWCHLFEDTRCDNQDQNHPVSQSLNHAKYMGEIPYNRYSASGIERNADYGVETR